MASINHYPARTQEQVFTCSAEANVIGREGDLQYMLVTMVEYADDTSTVKGQTVFRSAFPFYAFGHDGGEVTLYGFVRGEDSLETRINWDNFVDMSHPYDPRDLPHAYLKNCVLMSSDGFTSIGGAGRSAESIIQNDVDVLHITNNYTRIVEEGEHLGAIRLYASGITLLKESSSLPTTPEESPGTGPFSIYISLATARIRDNYYGSWLTTGPYSNYRIIYGKAFSSIQEWFQYCKTH